MTFPANGRHPSHPFARRGTPRVAQARRRDAEYLLRVPNDAAGGPVTKSSTQGSGWSTRDWVALAGITTLAGLLRLVRLGDPDVLVFDEAHYVQDACRYAFGMAEVCLKWVRPAYEVHPPLGKWLIAGGIAGFGYTAVGWRISAAIAGTLTVMLLYLTARRLLQATGPALVAALLLAIDLIHFVQSRLGMLDVFLAFFTTASVLCCLYDRDRDPVERLSQAPVRQRHPWRFAAGAAAGAAIACKWPGVFALATVLILVFWWECSARVSEKRLIAVIRTVREEGLSIVASLVITPLLVYVLSYAARYPPTLLTGRFWADFARYHQFVWLYHSRFGGSHTAQSPPWSWFIPAQPLAYFHEYARLGCREVAAFASPFWLLALLAVVLITIRAARTRSLGDAEGVILSGFALSYLPWLLVARNRSGIFIFYMLPTVPFLALALAHLATRMRRAIAVWTLLSVAFFVFYYPRMTAVAHLERLPVHSRACAGVSEYPP
ncbi:MAG: phospholipid carrier-dependent glycosyltransferase [Armatimonadota bacterium]|nr:phospholipid carrier-dependent glycosyltransferase [Armatimonadota bacterium]